MESDNRQRNIDYFESYWDSGVELYESHPTGRHRRRFIRNRLRKERGRGGLRIFDYGCGTGVGLEEAARILSLDEGKIGGCDISPRAIELVRNRFPGGSFYLEAYPEVDQKLDIVICSEVIEHTSEYRSILEWIAGHLREGGLLILTTPRIPMDPPDRAYGHVQHFRLDELVFLLRGLDFKPEFSREWGFPFFTLQKWVTRRLFSKVSQAILETPMNRSKHVLFYLVYLAYFIHDLIPHGPQLFIAARKMGGQRGKGSPYPSLR